MAALLLTVASCTGETEKKQAEVLKKLAAETPLFPGFEKTGENLVLKSGLVYYFNHYSSKTDFSSVKAFYDPALAQRNWKSEEEVAPSSSFVGPPHRVSYRRGDYVIAIAQDDRGIAVFDVVFEWDPQ
ncbi:MAG TPA: hypothetical protein VLL54_06195 [Pyrinomonadaceae bacterium]|nr:hypothetical protein [Pyrinomonadaceae bacterium]